MLPFKTIPTVRWFPGDASAEVFSWDQLPKAKTRDLFYEMFCCDDPKELCNAYGVTLEELCVAINFETKFKYRTNMQKILIPYCRELQAWSTVGVRTIKTLGRVHIEPPIFRKSV